MKIIVNQNNRSMPANCVCLQVRKVKRKQNKRKKGLHNSCDSLNIIMVKCNETVTHQDYALKFQGLSHL